MNKATIGAILLSLAAWLTPLHAASALKQNNEAEAIFINYEQFHRRPNIQPVPQPKNSKPLVSSKVHGQLHSGRNTTCDDFKEIVNKYFSGYTATALFVSSKESGCENKRSTRPNANGTYDYCIFQINNEPGALEIETCIRRAWEKFKGSNYTWRQWYAVCTPKTHEPKYPNIKCK